MYLSVWDLVSRQTANTLTNSSLTTLEKFRGGVNIESFPLPEQESDPERSGRSGSCRVSCVPYLHKSLIIDPKVLDRTNVLPLLLSVNLFREK